MASLCWRPPAARISHNKCNIMTMGDEMDFNLAVMVRESARRLPGKPAAVLGETVVVSYAELDELSDRVAANLTAAGLAVGERVGLQLPNVTEFVIAYFGILKAGGVVVPMNVLLKAGEIEFQLRDSGAVALITHGSVLGDAAEAAAWPGLPRCTSSARSHRDGQRGCRSSGCWTVTRPGRSWPRGARPIRP